MGKQPTPQMKKTLREYYATHALVHACQICRRTGLTLYKLGRDRNHTTVYGCAQHRTPS